ncbi:MAG: hypothetical protein OXR66_04495 [Candidatus Woesearchaeota archaeon]|nr:hypothetical protein [Candidatus Woesearchaeota archaeon]
MIQISQDAVRREIGMLGEGIAEDAMLRLLHVTAVRARSDILTGTVQDDYGFRGITELMSSYRDPSRAVKTLTGWITATSSFHARNVPSGYVDSNPSRLPSEQLRWVA